MPSPARAKGARVTIVSADKDLMQLVEGEAVVMYDYFKNREIGPDEVRERFGVGPERVIDVQALAGDSSDNVPGVPGIGVKTAAQLIEDYGDLDALLARAEEIKQPKRRQNLIEHAETARVSRELVTLRPMSMVAAADAAGGDSRASSRTRVRSAPSSRRTASAPSLHGSMAKTERRGSQTRRRSRRRRPRSPPPTRS